MYVLVRNDGKYVARPGSARSYTGRLEEARTFSTSDKANADRCVENERVVPLDSLLQSPD